MRTGRPGGCQLRPARREWGYEPPVAIGLTPASARLGVAGPPVTASGAVAVTLVTATPAELTDQSTASSLVAQAPVGSLILKVPLALLTPAWTIPVPGPAGWA